MGVNKAGDNPKIPTQQIFTERRAESATNLTNTFVRDRSLEKTSKHLALLEGPKGKGGPWEVLVKKVWCDNTIMVSPATRGAVIRTVQAARRAMDDIGIHAHSRKGHTLPKSKKPYEI